MCREEDFALPTPRRGYPELDPYERDPYERDPYEDYDTEQQRIGLGSAPSNGGSYGSPEADKAAARLQQLGVTVSPPGRSDSVDWQSLAGDHSLLSRPIRRANCIWQKFA